MCLIEKGGLPLAAIQPQGNSGSNSPRHPIGSGIPRQRIGNDATASTKSSAPDQAMSFNSPPIKLSILISAYNEEDTIARVIQDVLQVNMPCGFELIVVDDGSTDKTSMILSELNDDRMIVFRHSTNRGKGAALRSAASLATGTHILPFDADLEYLAEDIPRMLEPVLKGRCSVVYGTRLFGCNTVYQSFRYAAGNRLLTRMANILYDSSLSDLHTCLKLMPLAIMRSFELSEEGFGLDTELTALLLRNGIRPFEVPVSYYSRSRAQGKKIRSRDAITCAWILLRVRLRGLLAQDLANGLSGMNGHYRVPVAQSGLPRVGHIKAWLGPLVAPRPPADQRARSELRRKSGTRSC
jgi:dolichol-phosphate hexosyltransferase